jgi:ABC-type multidrug transport system ATPase subunit
MHYAIEAASLEKTYSRGMKALAGIDIKVRSGTIFGLLGPNGAGKSTTVKTGRENLELQAVLFLDEPTIGLDPKARVDMWHEIERLARDEGVTILLTTRERESLIGIVSLVTLPLIFLPTALMQASLLPHWVRWASRVNPVDWAVEGAAQA